MRKQPTSLDVARLAGVSQTTVSFVLNNRTDKVISPDTRERVMNAAAELRYRSNKLSNGILRGKTKLIGVVIPNVSDYYFGTVLSGISNYAHTSGFQVLMTISSGFASEVSEEDSITRLMEYRVDGIICIAYDWDSEARLAWLDEVLTKGIPVVIVDDRTQSERADCIVTDDFLGSRLAVNHLIEIGHKRIAHFAGSQNLSTGRDRQIGYISALTDAGLPVDESLIFQCQYEHRLAAQYAEKILNMEHPPDAVFTASDMTAAPILANMVSRGLKWPKDLAVVGYSNTGTADAIGLTSIEQDPESIGKRACQQILNRLEDRTSAPELITLPVKLIVRNSSN